MNLAFWLGLLLRAAVAYLQWKATEAEIHSKKLIFDLKELATQKTKEVDERILELRAAGRDADADRLRVDFFRETQLTDIVSTKLPPPVERYTSANDRGDLYDSSGRDMGIGGEVSGTGAGEPNPEPEPPKSSN